MSKKLILKLLALVFLISGIIFFIIFISYRANVFRVTIYDEYYYEDFTVQSTKSFVFFGLGAFCIFFSVLFFGIAHNVNRNSSNFSYVDSKNKTFKNVQTDGNNHFSSNDGVCPYCGNEVTNGDFCPYCGSKLK